MKLIVGLGNPGDIYANTRHNIGYILVELFFENWKNQQKWKSEISENSKYFQNFEKIIAVKPQTFMNLSGDALLLLVQFYKLNPIQDILILSDDIDMEFGKVRYRKSGSHGGQNGLRDIFEKLGTNEISRIKIGIGRHPDFRVSDWVLSKFTETEKTLLITDTSIQVQELIKKWLGE